MSKPLNKGFRRVLKIGVFFVFLLTLLLLVYSVLQPPKAFVKNGGNLERILARADLAGEWRIQELSPGSDSVCIVPQYTFTKDYLAEFGIDVDLNVYVAELNSILIILDGNDIVDYALLTYIPGTVRNRSQMRGCFSALRAALVVELEQSQFIFSIAEESGE